ncbi:MAG: flagellar basal body L-ring protein FlgH [Planctomycetes bacterium]|nr:flagellar basal body L-ring protein FlgH [Planctomycetota bacterium]
MRIELNTHPVSVNGWTVLGAARVVAALGLLAAIADRAVGQTADPRGRGALPAPSARGARTTEPERARPGAEPIAAGPRLDQTSWTYIPAPVPRQFEIEDLVYIRVNEIQSMTENGKMQRRRNALYDALLADWVVLNGLKSIKPAPQSDGDQSVEGSLNQLYRAQSDLETSERLTLNIAATIADIRPNGNLVVEAHKQVRNNNEVWEVSLSGICRPQDVADNNMVMSERIYDLRIQKRELGHVRDGYRRGWFVRWFDQFSPF